MILLAVAQVLGVSDLLDGTDADIDLDVDLDLDMDADLDADVSTVGAVDGLMSMIGLGRVPFTIWLASLLLLDQLLLAKLLLSKLNLT